MWYGWYDGGGLRGDGRGRRGGLALLWKKEWDVTVVSFSLNHIDVIISFQGGSEWRFTGIYGYPEDENKAKTCVLLNSLANVNRLPWLCGGDFNLMLWSSEKQGGGDFNFEHASLFQGALDHCELEDLYFNGHSFTWTNNQGGEKNLQERLDRFCANRGWRDLYGGSFVTHLEKRKSDHLPLVLSIKTRIGTPQKRQRRRLFRFEEMWMREESCEDTVKTVWRNGEGVIGNLARTATGLREWSKNKFGDFSREMRDGGSARLGWES